MITGSVALIAAVVCGVYAFVQWRYARRHAYLNIIHSEYNLWAGLGLLGFVVLMGASIFAFRAEHRERTRLTEIDQCSKAEMMWPGRTVFTDHCYVEVKEESGVYMRHASLDPNFYTKEEVLRRQP